MAISVETRHTLNAYAQSWIKMANKIYYYPMMAQLTRIPFRIIV